MVQRPLRLGLAETAVNLFIGNEGIFVHCMNSYEGSHDKVLMQRGNEHFKLPFEELLDFRIVA